ncbi:MAG: helical backbone metal receptor [Candidatus Omnitrophota bacterium]
MKKLLFIACVLVFWCQGPLYSQDYPQRIISLSPYLTEEIYLLGAQDRLIGCTVYCQRPPEARNKEKVGTVTDANLEKIVSLKPDLVLTASLTNPKTKEKLRNLGIRVVDFTSVSSFSQICGQFLELGRIIGKEKQAEEIVRQAADDVELIKKSVKGLPRPKVFVQIGAKPLYTVTNSSFVNDFIQFAGGINISQDAKIELYSREEVVRQDPDVIIIATMGITGQDEKAAWQRYKTISAVRNGRIHIIDSYMLCIPTPVNFTRTLKELVTILHPEK